MAEKVSTIIIKVDLECHFCYKKIRRTLCKLQDREIHSISYDVKKNTVTISGPFDPERLSKKLCSEACKVIKDIQIVVGGNDKKEKEKEKPKDSKPPAEPTKPVKPAEPAKPAKSAETAKPAEPQAEPAKQDKEKPKAQPEPEKPVSKPSPEPVVSAAQLVYQGYPAVLQAGPVCNCGPGYGPYYGGCSCNYSYGMNYGWVPAGPPVEEPKAGQFFSEADPTCSIM